MGTKNLKDTLTLVASGSDSSEWFDIADQTYVHFFAKWAGTGTGTLKLQYSPDKTEVKDVASSSQAVAAAGSFYWDIVTGAGFVRVVATETGGAQPATVTVWGKAK